jgi:nicotinamide-nucleotide amidase
MKATIITIGDELLLGQVLDTNAHFLSNALKEIGIDVNLRLTLKDSYFELNSGIAYAASQSDLIIMTGGLGPTNDDITKKVLADYFSCPLELNEEALKMVSAFLQRKGVELNANNKEQAIIPGAARILPNKLGTASGMWFSNNKLDLISLPGVPFEMKALTRESIIPELRKRSASHVITKFVLTQGLPESILAERISVWEDHLPENLSVAYLPSAGYIKLRITGMGDDDKHISNLIAKEVAKLYDYIPSNILGEDELSLEALLYNILTDSKSTLSTAESCTGGNIASKLVHIPGSSAFFKGGLVTYSNESKTALLGVDEDKITNFGAVSKEVVEQMAIGALTRFGTNYAIATSGIAGPSGGTEEKPVGTVWIAWAGKNKVISKQFYFTDQRDVNIARSANVAIGQLVKNIREGKL